MPRLLLQFQLLPQLLLLDHVPADAKELYFYFFYALLCFFPSQWVAFPRGVAGMKRGFAAGCALSFSAVKLCVSNVLCLTPPANHLSSTPPRIRHWFTHRVWWAEEGGGGRSLKQANGNGSGLHVMLVEVPKRKSRTRPAPCCSITNSTPSYVCVSVRASVCVCVCERRTAAFYYTFNMG